MVLSGSNQIRSKGQIKGLEEDVREGEEDNDEFCKQVLVTTASSNYCQKYSLTNNKGALNDHSLF